MKECYNSLQVRFGKKKRQQTNKLEISVTNWELVNLARNIYVHVVLFMWVAAWSHNSTFTLSFFDHLHLASCQQYIGQLFQFNIQINCFNNMFYYTSFCMFYFSATVHKSAVLKWPLNLTGLITKAPSYTSCCLSVMSPVCPTCTWRPLAHTLQRAITYNTLFIVASHGALARN